MIGRAFGAIAFGWICAAATLLAADPQPTTDLGDVVAAIHQRCVKLYGAGAGREHGYATGILIAPDGKILTALGIYLTSEHLRAVTADGKRYDVKELRRDEKLQVALLQIEAQTPHYFPLQRKMPAQPGDWVLAVSNAFNIATADEQLSANLGIISVRAEMAARHRAQDVPYAGDVLLVDAITSNPGAPGGALCTLDGQLAGMIGKLLESKNTGTRINYAVPLDALARFVAEEHPAADTTAAKPEATPAPATTTSALPPVGGGGLGIRLFRLGGERSPAYVDSVAPGSAAKDAGLRKDDLILAIGNTEIRTCQQYDEAVKRLAPGAPLELLVKRGRTIQAITVRTAGRAEKIQ